MAAEKRRRIFIWIAGALFLLALAYCLPKTDDDWTVTLSPAYGTLTELMRMQLPRCYTHFDGRIIANILACVNANSKALRVLFWTLTVAVLLLASERLTQGERRRSYWLCLPLLMLLLSPKEVFAGDLAWMYGFLVYVPPVAITLTCLVLISAPFLGRPVEDTWGKCIACCLLGFAGQLFSEVSTLYAVCMAAGMLIWHWISFKRPSRTMVFYLLGTVAGLCVMFSSPAYGVFFARSGSVASTTKSIAVGLDSMLRTFRDNYAVVSAFCLGRDPLPTALVSVCGIALLVRQDGKRRAAETLAAAVLAAAPVYLFFTACDLVTREELASFLPFGSLFGSDSYAIVVDLVVVTAYLLSVLYVLLERTQTVYGKRFGCFLLASYVFCVAPLFFVTPVVHRVAFSAYVFLSLLGLTMLGEVLTRYPSAERAAARISLAAAAACCTVYLAMFCTNPRVERQKLDYAARCAARGDAVIKVPRFLFAGRLYRPESSLGAAYFHETLGDTTYEYLPYEQWYDDCYLPSGPER